MTVVVKNNPMFMDPILETMFKRVSKEDKRSCSVVCKKWAEFLASKELRTPKRQVFETPEIFVNIFQYFNTKELFEFQQVCSVFDKNIQIEELRDNVILFEKYKKETPFPIAPVDYVIPHLQGIYQKAFNVNQFITVTGNACIGALLCYVPNNIVCNFTASSSRNIPIKHLDVIREWMQEVTELAGKNCWKIVVNSKAKTFQVLEIDRSTTSTLAYKMFNNEGKILAGIFGIAIAATAVYHNMEIRNYLFSHSDQTKSTVENKVKIKISDSQLKKFGIDKRLLPKFPMLCCCDMEIETPSTSFSLDASNDQVGNNGGHIVSLSQAKKSLKDKKCEYLGIKVGPRNIKPLISYISKV